jgi:hypothetical protein
MRKIELKTRKLLRKIFGGISLTAIAFVFQACYGIEPDCSYDMHLSGKVLSKTTQLPVKGIKVSVANSSNYAITDENGLFDFYACIRNYEESASPDNIPVLFKDIDDSESDSFSDKEIFVDINGQSEVKINVELEERN